MRLIVSLVSFLMLAFTAAVVAGEKSETATPSKVTLSGIVDFGMGEVMSGNYRAVRTGNGGEWIQYPHLTRNQWFGNPLTRMNLDIEPSEKLKVLIGFEGNIFLNTFPPEFKSEQASNGGSPLMTPFMGFALHQAQGIFSLLNEEAMSLTLSLGYIPYKYNPEVCNLGEFLFRSGTYPFFLMNDFNFPLQRLSGALLSFSYGGLDDGTKVSIDQFVRMERTFAPLNDFSISTIVGFDLYKLINAGFGVDFSRLFPVNGDLTTPKGAFYPSAVDTVKDGSGNPELDAGGYVKLVARDTAGYYSFKGTKLMARATIDPFTFFDLRKSGDLVGDIVGENGGKLYGEIAIIGTKNYPANPLYKGSKTRYEAETVLDADYQINPWGYTKVSERMPWMIGINLPFWKILDRCALELEKYPAPYPNDVFQALYNNALPIPSWSPFYRKDSIMVQYDPVSGEPDTTVLKNPLGFDAYSGSRFYWSVYMLKRFGDHVSVYGQVARDHQRWDVNLGNEFNYSAEEIMARAGDWAWRLGVLYEF